MYKLNTKAERICRKLGIKYPIFQAGLGGIAGPDLTAAVSNSGAIGHLGGIRMSSENLRQWIKETKQKTSKPFGVNLVPPGGGPDGFEAQFKVVLDEKPAVVSLFWGTFESEIKRAKDNGILTMVQVGSVKEAIKAANDGADMVIAQGIEAGGHVRGKLGLLPFVSELLKSIPKTPVIAAGGIARSSDVETLIKMGVAGVWVGTRFVATDESIAHDYYKQRLVKARVDDPKHERLYSFGWKLGTPYRSLPGANWWHPLGWVAGGARRQDGYKKAKAIKLYAGQSVGGIKKIEPAKNIVNELSRGIKRENQ